ncbi:hypothetical protein LCGC14_0587920 [marine sediment metagenome]|uniref:Uncharacterized protein n=1 Tax=marine sediment metagenome TaxID=412755 RepID=A0A0F9RJH7_9ZZZZ
MKKHEHHDCEHIMKFCKPCNEAYCGKCDAVWASEPCTLSHYPWIYNTPTITWPYYGTTTTTTTYDDTGDNTFTTSHALCASATS